MKKSILTVCLMACLSTLFAQFNGDKLFVRANVGGAIGFEFVTMETYGNGFWNETTWTFMPGSHFSPEIAVGASLYKNLSAEVNFAYLIQLGYSNINGEELFFNFSRLSVNGYLKYAFELKPDKFALVPGFGIGATPGTKIVSRDDFSGIDQTIDYGTGFATQTGLEAQIRVGKKAILNPGIRYRTESISAKSVSYGELEDLDPDVKDMSFGSIQVIFGVIIPLVQENKFGRKR